MQADAFLFQKLVEPGDLVVVEAPTYDRTLLALRKLGAEILAIPLEADGIDVDALEIALERGRAADARPHHPQLPEPGRLHALARQAPAAARARRGVRLHDLRGRPLRGAALRGRARCRRCSRSTSADCVVYASSFSKTVCPGIRVGYLVGPAERSAAIRKRPRTPTSRRTWSPSRSWPSSATRARSTRSIETVKAALRERRDATADALERHLPDATYVTPEGGYFLWVDLPEGTDVAALAARAAERGVVFVKGTDFLIEGGDSSLRIAYSGGAAGPDRGGHRARRRGRVAGSWPARLRERSSSSGSSAT